MGGPMNVSQHREHPWLRAEKRAILDAIAAGKRLLGVCLGAQLIADVLGGTVSKNREREIGWFPVRSMPGGAASPFAFPDETAVFHWHAETFSLPPGGVLLAASAGCANQAFAFGRNVLALQFHLEMTATEIGRIARECAGELTPGRYVQSADEMIASAAENEPATSALLDRLLTALEKG
jgi:GMP synthase-like glutamine amidotransferase